MMSEKICLNCQTPNAPQVSFCTNCGTSLTITCPSCQQKMEIGQPFCTSCGTPLTASVKASSSTASSFPLSTSQIMAIILALAVIGVGGFFFLNQEDNNQSSTGQLVASVASPTNSPTPIRAQTLTATPRQTPTPTPKPTQSPSPTPTRTQIPTATLRPTATPIPLPTQKSTPTQEPTAIPTIIPTKSFNFSQFTPKTCSPNECRVQWFEGGLLISGHGKTFGIFNSGQWLVEEISEQEAQEVEHFKCETKSDLDPRVKGGFNIAYCRFHKQDAKLANPIDEGGSIEGEVFNRLDPFVIEVRLQGRYNLKDILINANGTWKYRD